MLVLEIPEELTSKVTELARKVYQTPEEFVVELIEERVAHHSAYDETDYLAKSERNRKRLDEAVRDIDSGKYETHGLLDADD